MDEDGDTRAGRCTRTLSNGATVELRPLTRDDADALVETYRRLSEASVRERFHEVSGGLSEAQLAYFTDLDHHDHEALTVEDVVSGALLGVARYIRGTRGARQAEVAVVVVDAHQHLGVGELLVDALAQRARDEGVESFVADVLAGNDAMLALLRRLGEVATRTDGEDVTATVALGGGHPPPPRPSDL